MKFRVGKSSKLISIYNYGGKCLTSIRVPAFSKACILACCLNRGSWVRIPLGTYKCLCMLRPCNRPITLSKRSYQTSNKRFKAFSGLPLFFCTLQWWHIRKRIRCIHSSDWPEYSPVRPFHGSDWPEYPSVRSFHGFDWPEYPSIFSYNPHILLFPTTSGSTPIRS